MTNPQTEHVRRFLNALWLNSHATRPRYRLRRASDVARNVAIPSEELAAFQASETRKWGEIVTVAGMKEP